MEVEEVVPSKQPSQLTVIMTWMRKNKSQKEGLLEIQISDGGKPGDNESSRQKGVRNSLIYENEIFLQNQIQEI